MLSDEPYGQNVTSVKDHATRTFPAGKISSVSFCTTPIEILSNDGRNEVLANATGFFVVSNGLTCLVTNWHVVSGRDFFSRELNRKGLVPTKLRFFGAEISGSQNDISVFRRNWEMHWVDGHEDLLREPPLSSAGPCDVWVMPIPEKCVFRKDPQRTSIINGPNFSAMLNENMEHVSIQSSAGDQCKVLGYPFRVYDGGKFPIWKTCSFATEPNMGIGKYPAFLIDGVTAAGMSGAPILRCETVSTSFDDVNHQVIHKRAFNLVGIYAGRQRSSNSPLMGNEAPTEIGIGYGWYSSLIDEVHSFYCYSDFPSHVSGI